MYKALFSLIFILIPFYSVFGINKENNQRSVSGLVFNMEGKPLAGASVLVKGTTLGVGTNSKGEFNLLLQSNKETVLRVSFVGYHPKEYKLKKNDTNITVILEESINCLEEVVVTGSRIERPLKDVPIVTRMITADEIKKINPMEITSLLQYELPGLQFGRHHGTGLPTMQYQGTAGNYMLFLIDGERLSGEGAADNVDFSRFNIDEIERIEVVKGAMSTLYGSNALGGVINIITKEATQPFTGNISSRYCSIGEQKHSISLGTKQKRFSSLTNFSFRQKDPFTVSDTKEAYNITTNADGTFDTTIYKVSEVPIKGYRLWDASQKLKYVFSDNFSAQTKISYYNNRRLNTNNLAKFEDVYNDFTINTKLNYFMTENQFLDFSYTLDNFTKHYDFLLIDKYLEIYNDLINIARLNYTASYSDNNILTAGIEVNTENLKHYMFLDTGKHSNQNYVFYIQDERKFTDNFSVVPGLRFDYHSIYNLHVTPRISAMLKSDILTIRGGYAAGFRSPSLKELYSDYDMGGLGIFQICGNPNLQPETSHQFSLSGEINKGILNFSLSSYYNSFIDKIGMEWREDSTGYPNYVYINAEDARTAGIEGILRLKFGFGLSTQFSYSFTEDYQEVNGLNTSAMRPHNVTFNLAYTKKISSVTTITSINGYWMSGINTYVFNSEEKSYSHKYYEPRYICSAQIGVKLPRGIDLNLGVNNLLNFKDKNISSTQTIMPEQGVSFIASMAINLSNLFNI